MHGNSSGELLNHSNLYIHLTLAVLEDPVHVSVDDLPDGDGQEDDDEADQEHGDEHAAQHVQAAVRVIWNSKYNVRLDPRTEVFLR